MNNFPRYTRRPLLFFALALFAALPVVPGPARAGDAAQAFVQSLSDRATQILQDKSLDKDGRFEAFRVMILNNTDIDRIGDFAIGRYAQAMRDAGKYDDYKRLFRDYVVRIYASRLSNGTGQSLRIIRSAPLGKTDTLVFCMLDPPKGNPGNPLAVNWRLTTDSANDYKIKDVQIAGAWMAIEQQSQFQSIISNNKRNPVSLIDYLEQKLKEPLAN